MNYLSYHSVDVVNGQGTRCTLFVAGCEHQCRGCYNQKSWRCDSGHPYTDDLEQQIINDLNDSRIRRKGLSLSGGDPLHPNNLDAVQRLVERVRKECASKDIWMWTGYKLQELNPQQQAIVKQVDTLIDGKFEQELADPKLQWRGSSNQIIHCQPLQ
ncbi:anaerobic ribonucleoside-triphosphate reductase-activating protein [Agarivorans sp. B2Z047]|uniref:anaerobic ribonucleoside-triphosphate reductase-activating protein n=1 Tax=Agarivorans sp. B2Z047 TaxID=2652721 RepID=UPI00128BE214|nr:anaerobic ribonucleoside-triphosphate reductase-activating protein [Agarivorans sp. B2Z047]MPW31045.1 anaerobic ribonucleoside-triphosphate reductase-activating protein [Agarivorans sp. B2Z047]UQN40725.1 anaerobic ribonucleoside-triphosphate reductase-activating protein [Agarivorans sp. B2Z047]